MVYLLLRIGAMALLLSISGCTPIAVSVVDTWPDDFPQKNVLTELVGKHESEVLQKLGHPTYFVKRNDLFYFVYENLEDGTYIDMFFLVPVWGGSDNKLSCVLLKFDQHKLLQSYEVASASAATNRNNKMMSSPGYYEPITCQKLFRIIKDQVFYIDKCAYERIGYNLSAHEMYMQYERLAPNDLSRLKYLCGAADQGHPNAQIEVGRHFSEGVEGVPHDLRRAYVWYSLAMWCFPDDSHLQLTKQKMTGHDITEAERMLDNWEPGHCEAELGL